MLRRDQPLLGIPKSSIPASYSGHGTSGPMLSLSSPALPLSSWEYSSNGCDPMRGGSIGRFLPRRLREGSGLVAVETAAVSATKTLQSEHSPTRIRTLPCSDHTGRLLPISRASKAYRSMLYAITVFISFFLMLVFMTYNVRDHVHANCGPRLLMTAAGVFDFSDGRRSWYRALHVFRIWLGRRREGDGLSLRLSVCLYNRSPDCDSRPTETRRFRSPPPPVVLSTSVCSFQGLMAEYTHSLCEFLSGLVRSMIT